MVEPFMTATTGLTIVGIVVLVIDKILVLVKRIKKCNIKFGNCCSTEVVADTPTPTSEEKDTNKNE
jgi:hypothetical protein